MSSKSYSVAGTSNLNGVVKARFANSLSERIKILTKSGHIDINLIELPSAMTKEQASNHLATLYTAGTPEHAAVSNKIDSITVKSRRTDKRDALQNEPVVKTPTPKATKASKTPVVNAKSAPAAKRVRPSRSKAAVAARAAEAEAVAIQA